MFSPVVVIKTQENKGYLTVNCLTELIITT